MPDTTAHDPTGTGPGGRLAQVVDMRLDVVDALFAELGYPHHPFKDRARHGDRVRQREVASGDSLLVSDHFRPLAVELISGTRKVEDEALAAGYRIGSGRRFLAVYGDGGLHPEGFVLASIGQQEAPRLFPASYPSDIVDLGVSQLRAGADRVRFFCELTRIYCDAVRLSGEFVGVRPQLFSALSRIAGVLSEQVRCLRLPEGENSEDQRADAAEETADGPQPQQSGLHETSPSVGESGDPTVGDEGGSAAVAAEPDPLERPVVQMVDELKEMANALAAAVRRNATGFPSNIIPGGASHVDQ